MTKICKLALVLVLMTNTALADCDFKTGITSLPDGGYRYSQECHLKVGTMVKEIENKDKAIADLSQAITLKDLAIQKADQRTQLWMDTSFKIEERMESVNNLHQKNELLYFALGAATVLAAGYMASQLIH